MGKNFTDIEAFDTFKQIQTRNIASLGLRVTQYEHKTTGAMHVHLASDNTENVFMVAFRTMPMDDTGVAHILEHTALCGSKRYPVRDPFFMMIRRSLNTFMNAFTSSDWTAYPFASQNRKDFENLLQVYLDAAFFSRLDPLDFAQEGHRMALKDPNDLNSELCYQGVVFNEMKGAMSSPESMLWHRLSRHLFPTTTYHYNSGGEPADIPSLTYESLQAFYQSHYHPSNAVFMTYGDLPAEWHQQRFEEFALKDFQRGDTGIAVAQEQRLSAPIRVTEPYALDETKQRTYHVMAWLLGDVTDLAGLMESYFLSKVLLDHSASPLMHALETNDLGTGPAPMCEILDSTREVAFVCGIEGSEPDQVEAFEQLVLKTLQDIIDNGVALADCESVLRQLELEQREVGGAGYPYGLQLVLRGLTAAIHRSDPLAYLDMDVALVRMRSAIQDSQYVPNLIKRLLLNNKHRVTLTLAPDADLARHQLDQEKTALAKARTMMSEQDLQTLQMRNQALTARQNQQEDMEILPKVTPADVPTDWYMATGQSEDVQGVTMHSYAQPCNGIVYHDVVMPFAMPECWQALPWFNACITELGCGQDDYKAMQVRQYQASGGIGASCSIVADPSDAHQAKAYFVMSGKALMHQGKGLTQLLWDTLTQVRFDEDDRIKDILYPYAESKRRAITGSGHALAMLAASSVWCPASAFDHCLFGLSGTAATLAMIKNFDTRLPELTRQFQAMHEGLMAAPRQHLLIGDEAALPQLREQLASIAQGSEVNDWLSWSSEAVANVPMKQMWIVDSQVNFCAKAYPTVGIGHPDNAPLSVLALIMRNGFCHRAIREQGGAYGGGAVQSSGHHSLRFYSYRDPRLSETLDDFDKAVDWVLNESWPDSLLDEAILGIISQIDKPSSPAGEARKAFYNSFEGINEAMLQQRRAEVLSVTVADVKRVAERYLQEDKASIAVITSTKTLDDVGDLDMTVLRI